MPAASENPPEPPAAPAPGSAPESAPEPRLTMHLRIVQGEGTVLGPGKVELLGLIAETGSIAEAARRMGMSYNRAWLHVKVMNGAFQEPLVLSSRGGPRQGGATLSELGVRVCGIYETMRQEARAAVQAQEQRLVALLARR